MDDDDDDGVVCDVHMTRCDIEEWGGSLSTTSCIFKRF